MLKKLIIGGLGSALSLALFALPAAAVTVPAECVGMTFDHVIVGTQFGSVLNGSSGRDLIIGVGGDIIKGNGGDDCLVSGGLSIVNGGAGNDTIVAGYGDIVNGGTGSNTCTNLDYFSQIVRNCN